MRHTLILVNQHYYSRLHSLCTFCFLLLFLFTLHTSHHLVMLDRELKVRRKRKEIGGSHIPLSRKILVLVICKLEWTSSSFDDVNALHSLVLSPNDEHYQEIQKFCISNCLQITCSLSCCEWMLSKISRSSVK